MFLSPTFITAVFLFRLFCLRISISLVATCFFCPSWFCFDVFFLSWRNGYTTLSVKRSLTIFRLSVKLKVLSETSESEGGESGGAVSDSGGSA